MSQLTLPAPAPFHGPSYWLEQERRNLLLFAAVAAMLAVLTVLHFKLQWQVLVAGLQTRSISVAAAASEPAEPAAAAKPALDGRMKAIAQYLAKRYQVSADATRDLVAAAQKAGGETGLDPLLILAVAAVESRFNPIAESVAGAKGIMQVIPRFHPEKFEPHGGEHAVLDPKASISVGARILKEYIARTGSLNAGLQLYGGAASDESNAYSNKVIGERQRFEQAVVQTRA